MVRRSTRQALAGAMLACTAFVSPQDTWGQSQPVGASADRLTLTPCVLRAGDGFARIAAECGRLAVPENPATPDGPTIELFVARIKSLRSNPAADAVTLINGGPGASSVDLYVDLAGAFAPLLLERDIVLVDQRGTGRSAPLACEASTATITAFDAAVVREETARCLASLTADPRFYTTALAVDDLERVRAALGYSQWNLYGVSYGTRVAQHFLQRHPGSVRTLVLDGVVPPDHALGADIALNAARALDSIFARCGDEPACAGAFTDIRARFERLAARLRASPVDVELADPVSGRPTRTTLTYGHLAATVRILSYAPETAAVLPLLIAAAETQENYLPLALQAQRIERELGRAISVAMHNSVVCSEDVPFWSDLADTLPALERTYLGTDQVRMLETLCAVWPRGVTYPELKAPLASATPTLLLSGEFDPITPPGYAERAAAGLSNAHHVVAPGQGHGVIARGCLPEVVADFVRTGAVSGLATDCVRRLGPDPFFVDLMGPPP
ncbi:MAG: alpha/beta fold hydrolase [Pseudomonadales bacterium]|nr:alpha/beta fold hydrolase [Pseudomonadales bacterium]